MNMKNIVNTTLVIAPLLLTSLHANATMPIEVPEPSVLALFGVGLAILGLVNRKK